MSEIGASPNRARLVGWLEVLTALVALCGLMPIAGAFPAMFSGPETEANTIWLVINLGGALLLLAGGLKLLLPAIGRDRFILAFSAALAIIGMVRFHRSGFGRLTGSWLILAILIGISLSALRFPARWSGFGTAWCFALLLAWSVGGVMSYLAATAPRLPLFLAFQMAGCILTMGLLVIHVRFTHRVNDL